ncbi:CDP-alcohol phosphatidyltransferase family protein [Lacibacterium aquatile]|uniref:CDP-alcohol phosphatidyltransferase family protein n=1 Tax=Lacibacterium aquatile TaxID=1168082 RepID=A0ABW5DV82_9PROT
MGVAERQTVRVGYINGTSPLRLWGLSPDERLRRSLKRVGADRIAPSLDDGPKSGESAVLLQGDWVFDEALVRKMVERSGVALLADDGTLVAVHGAAEDWPVLLSAIRSGSAEALPPGIERLTAEGLGGSYNNALRKREIPLLSKVDETSVKALEARLFAGSYKGVTDAITKYVWPGPASRVTKFCSVVGITPNQVTLTSLAFVLGAFWAFWTGHFAIGLVMAWIMTFLDTVDGKLARVTLTSTKFGNVFDHGIDLIHPPFWWWAWIVGLGAAYDPNNIALIVIVAGYILQRVEEGIFMRAFGIEMHIWRRFDSRFRLITARRNPNLLILTVALILGEPAMGMTAVAIWTALSFAVHTLQILQGAVASRRGKLVSWLAQ